MGWFDKLRPNGDTTIMLRAADRVFTDLSKADNFAAAIYRAQPNRKKADWKKIKAEIKQLSALPYGKERTQKFRKTFADTMEVMETSSFYLNLSDADRALYAQHLLQSTKEVQDHIYHFDSTYLFMYSVILEFIIFESWDGDEYSKNRLKELQKNYLDLCRDHCQLTMKIANARSEGRELTPEEKEAGKTVVTLREATRRTLSGEKLFDDQ